MRDGLHTIDSVRDPVCGMSVKVHPAALSREYQGTHFFFCSARCLEKFNAEPAKYVSDPTADGLDTAASRPFPETASLGRPAKYTCPMHPEVKQSAPSVCTKCGMALEAAGEELGERKTEYFCPMHPEIVRVRPEACPRCGMALEPREVSVEGQPSEELRDMSRRLWVSVALVVPIFVLDMSDLIPGKPLERVLTMTSINWGQFVLATPVVLWCGWPFFERAWRSLVNRSLNMFTLIGLGIGVAYTYSVVATLLPGAFPASLRGANGALPVYFEAAAMITALVLLG
jgi:Cu+-exporting ATPase